MADKFSNYIEAVGFHMSLDCFGNVGNLIASSSLRDAQIEGIDGHIH